MLGAMDQGIPGDTPITLVIKAPNQRMADQTVECMLGWTIRKLKQHLETVYPSKPKHNEQRLIYSGKLLQDHLTLKEILRQYDGCEQPTKHTVHLVCSSSTDSASASSKPNPEHKGGTTPREASQSNSSISEEVVAPTQVSSQPSATEGLRYRGTTGHNVQIVPPAPGATVFTTAGLMPQSGYVGAYPAMYPAYPGVPMSSTPAYTPEQHSWLMQHQQQAYSQYMMQYMHYYQSVYYPGQHFDAQAMAAYMQQQQLHPAAQQLQQQQRPQQEAAGPEPNNNNDANNMPRMNVQGRMDDDDDLEPRDWLHHFYFVMRCLTFMVMLFFYSNFTRFLLVSSGFIAIYFLQKIRRHMQRIQQAQEQERQREEEERQRQQAEQQLQQQQQNNTETNTENAGEATEGATVGATEGAAVPGGPARATDAPPQEAPAEEGHWITRTFVFICMTVQAFFTSLLPTPPELLEAN